MAEVYHLNCVRIVTPFREHVSGHCLLIKEDKQMALIDTGIGLLDTRYPEERIGRPSSQRDVSTLDFTSQVRVIAE